MKKILLLIILFLILCCNFSIYAEVSYEGIGDVDKLVYTINRQFTERLRKQYGLKILSNTLGGPHEKIEVIGISLYTTQLLNKKEARELIISCFESYLREIFENQELQSHLCDSFSLLNLELDIYVNNKKRDSEKFRNLGMVGIRSGEVEFIVFNPENSPPILSDEYEPYEEALRIVQEERKALLDASHDFFQCILKK
jgi:hypothetical protein